MTSKWIISLENPTGKAVELTTEEQSAFDTAKAEVEKDIADNGTFAERRNARVKKEATDKASGNQKLKDLGLTDDEIIAITQ
tara:strand:+ start:690 stop:935 length:246 start_codon:yes stop_codon:yes gene_type:complete